MSEAPRILTPAEQVAAHIKQELIQGRWAKTLPGIHSLRKELGYPRNAIEKALILLEEEQIIQPTGVGKKRQILLDNLLDSRSAPPLRVGLLVYSPAELYWHMSISLRHRLMKDGHIAQVAPKTLLELDFDVKKIAKVVSSMEVDAWILLAAPSEIIRWFKGHSIPTLSFAGVCLEGIPVIAPSHAKIITEVIDILFSLGHSRISWLTRAKITPFAFVDAMKAHGISTTRYHAPSIGTDKYDLQQCIDTLFAMTPPTTLIIDDVELFFAIERLLAQRGINAPKNISLICTDWDPKFDWCEPSIAHMRWDNRLALDPIMKWVKGVSRGIIGKENMFFEVEFINGETLGPVPRILQ